MHYQCISLVSLANEGRETSRSIIRVALESFESRGKVCLARVRQTGIDSLVGPLHPETPPHVEGMARAIDSSKQQVRTYGYLSQQGRTPHVVGQMCLWNVLYFPASGSFTSTETSTPPCSPGLALGLAGLAWWFWPFEW